MKMRNLAWILVLSSTNFAYGFAQECNEKSIIFDAISGAVSHIIPSIYENPYKKDVARVRFGNELAPQERAYCAKREHYIKKSLQEHALSIADTKKVPTIALVCSGGGYRAMLYAMGALHGAQESGLLDYCTYVVGLSGSTWAMASWLSSGKPIGHVHDWLIDHLCFEVKDFDQEDISLAAQIMLAKYFADQPVGFVDFYGAFVVNDIFDHFTDDKNRVYLSQQAKAIQDGLLPFPIYTAINGASTVAESCWYEFTPYEIGASWLGMYVPTWGFGRKFEKGFSISSDPEQPLATFLGTFGLAVGLTVARMLKESGIVQNIKTSLMKKILEKIIKNFGEDRPISADYHNFTQGILGCPLAGSKELRLVDAGLNINLPYAPISGQRPERKADIIIFIDASAGKVAEELKGVQNYARCHGLKFPPISYTDIEKHAFTVFKDDADPETPIVIYVPRIVDELLLAQHKKDPMFTGLYETLHGFDVEKCMEDGACNTFNFFYSKEEARAMSALGECNIKCAHEAAVAAIKQRVEQQVVSIL